MKDLDFLAQLFARAHRWSHWAGARIGLLVWDQQGCKSCTKEMINQLYLAGSLRVESHLESTVLRSGIPCIINGFDALREFHKLSLGIGRLRRSASARPRGQ